ncbi:GntR family transcriptional regulator [Rhizobium sp. NFR07]|uniref:GntR family transcriptional regulator n=1 Tax=Rhizobium sp. NFR07 TaxID=1566262 RepID=UPI0008E57A17|nr:GntR family transcriptional regulator [Rhizobium sp. NFR07]SFA72898.1 GntR family transcriptional regulator [Rhizobium sp. NFR07]
MSEDDPDKKPLMAPRSRIQPLYHQIYLQLRQLLTDSSLDITQPLPSEPMLAQRYGVSRVTIRKTLLRLQQEGLIRRVHGKGTFPARESTEPGKSDISSVLDNLLSFDRRTTAVNLAWEMLDAEPAIARQLRSERCLRVVRLRSMEGKPISLTTLHIPERHCHLLDPEEIGDEPIVRALERGDVLAYDADQVLSAVAATADMALHLQVEPATPLIVMRRLMFNANHEPVLHQEGFYPPDRFEYRMRLSRQSIGPIAQWSPIS